MLNNLQLLVYLQNRNKEIYIYIYISLCIYIYISLSIYIYIYIYLYICFIELSLMEIFLLRSIPHKKLYVFVVLIDT